MQWSIRRKKLLVFWLACLLLSKMEASGADSTIKPGDVVFTTQQARVMSGEDEVARTKPGEQLTVHEIKREWAQVELEVKGEKTLVWIKVAFLQRKADISREKLQKFFLFESLKGDEDKPPYPRPWKEKEKQLVLDSLMRLQQAAPGLLARVTAYRPVKMYRVLESHGKEWAIAYVPEASHSVYFTDKAFETKSPESVFFTLGHEFAHIADLGMHLSVTEDWASAVGPRIQRIKQSLADAGVTVPNDGQTQEDVIGIARRFNLLAREQGLPRLYAATNQQEALATCFEFYLGGGQLPREIRDYLEQALLKLPYKPRSDLKTLHAALQAKKGESIPLLTRVIEEGSGLRAFAYTMRGARYKAGGKYDQALADYDKALTAFQHSVRARVFLLDRRADVHLLLKEHPKAIAAISDAIALSPQNPQLYLRRGNLLKSAKSFAELKESADNVLSDYDRALKLAPNYYTALDARAYVHNIHKQYKLAEEDYTRMIKLKPDLYFTYINRAKARFELKKYHDALVDFDKGIELYGDRKARNPDAYMGRAKTKLALEDWQGTVDDCNSFMKSWPQSWPDFNFLRGQAYLGMGDYDKAVDDFLLFNRAFRGYRVREVAPFLKKALTRLAPKTGADFQKRGSCWQILRHHKEAVEDLTKAIELSISDVAVYKTRGMSLFTIGQYKEAAADFGELIRLNPKNANSYSMRGLAWLKSGDPKKAIEDFSETIRLSPKHAQSLAFRGIAWRTTKQYQKAIDDLTRAIELHSTNPSLDIVHFERGMTWKYLKNYDKAIEDYDKALKIKPDNKSVYVYRARVQKLKGEFAKVVADYKKAIALDPKYVRALNGLAWSLATCPDEVFRDGTKAVEYATRACELTEWRKSFYFDTLAAAYAEVGDFESAVTWQTKSLGGARQSQIEEFRKRLELYKAKKPYRDESVE